jgi:hypothetical protein
MKDKANELERTLHDQQAAELEKALLGRLQAAAEGTLTELNEDEVRFEARLRSIHPKRLGSQLIAALESKVEGLPAPNQVHILPFPGIQAYEKVHQTRFHQTAPWAAAAAAICLLGVLTAFWLDPLGGPANTVGKSSSGSSRTSSASPPLTLPTEFSRALSQTQDKGIIWPSNDEPHRVIKVTYTDKVTMKREDGSTYEVEKPRVEYYLVPTDSH